MLTGSSAGLARANLGGGSEGGRVPPSEVIVRFWIVSFILALLALTTLKLR